MTFSAFINRTLSIPGINFQVEENPLNTFDRYTYHFTLSMVGELESKDANIADRLALNPASIVVPPQPGTPQGLQPVRKIIVAQSGVTVGLNIVDIEIDDSIGTNLRYKNTTTTEIRITLTEPYGINLVDQMFRASQDLGVNNWRLAPLFLELDFKGLNANGSQSASSDFNIRKVWKILLIDMESTLTQVGTTYKIKAAGQNTLGFMDQFFQIPSSTKVTIGAGSPSGQLFPAQGNPQAIAPGTINDFFTKLGKQLTDYYQEQRVERGLPIIVYEFKIAEIIGKQQIDTGAYADRRRVPFASVSPNGRDIIVSKGISITALLDDLIASTVVQNNQPWFLESEETGIVIIPRVECIVQNIGYDSLNNDYVRKLTFVVSAKRSTRPVISRSVGRGLQVGASSATPRQDPRVNQRSRLRIITENGLRKAYPYYYTGLNTEIINLNVVFQNMHIIPLPLVDSTSRGAGDFSRLQTLRDQRLGLISDLEAADLRFQQRRLSLGPNNPLTLEFQRQADNLRQQLFQVEDEIARLLANTGQVSIFRAPDEDNLRTFRDLGGTLTADLRNELARAERQNQQRLTQLRRREFVEDLPIFTVDPGQYTYIVDPKDLANTLSRSPANPQEDYARQYYTTVLAQIYDRNLNQLTEIEMDIRGDPYWLGKSNLEREKELLKLFDPQAAPQGQAPTPEYIGSIPSPGPQYANYFDYDAHFLLLFRAGQPPSPDVGLPNLNQSVWFTAIYIAYQVTHKFSNGTFTQRLTAVRDGLINLGSLKANPSGATGATGP